MTSFSSNVKKIESSPYSELLNQEHHSLLRTCTEIVIPRQFPKFVHYRWLDDFIKTRKDEKGITIHEFPTFTSVQHAVAYIFPIIHDENSHLATEILINYIRRVNHTVALEAYTKDELTLKNRIFIKLLDEYPCTINPFSCEILIPKQLCKILKECPASITNDLKNFAKYIIRRFPFTSICPGCYRLHTFSAKPENLGRAPYWLLKQEPMSYLQHLLLPEHPIFIGVDRFTQIWQRRNEFNEDNHRQQKYKIFSVQQLEYSLLFKEALCNGETIDDRKFKKTLLSEKEQLEVLSSLRILPHPLLPYEECYCLEREK